MISAVFVDRPRLAAVISIVLTIAGLLSLLVIPISQYPDIVPPQVSVTTYYPGASSAVVEATVGQPIEAQVVGVDKMIYMKSVSGNDGSYTLTVSFELGTDPDINTVNVNNRVQTALAKLPQEVRQQGADGQEEILGAARRRRRLFAERHLRRAVHQQLRHHQRARPDPQHARRGRRLAVQSAGLFHAGLGADRPADRPRPHHRRHYLGDPAARMPRRRSAASAPGRSPTTSSSSSTSRPRGGSPRSRSSSASSSAPIPTGRCCGSAMSRRIELGAQSSDRASRFNGKPAALIAIYQSPGANALSTLDAVKHLLAEQQREFPDDLAWKVTYDPTTFVTATIHEVQKTLVEAFVLVVLVVFLFLGSWRATLIPTIAVPVSLIGTFIVLNAIGYSANSVSLLAIVLAIGIVVDDAIVVVENVEHVMEAHPELSVADATKRAMGQITAPIIAITLGAAQRVRAGGVHLRHLRRAVPPVRGDRRRLDVHLRHQRPDPLAGTLRGAAQAPARTAARTDRRGHALHRPGARRLRVHRRPLRARRLHQPVRGGRLPRRHLRAVQGHAHRLPAGGRPGRVLRRHPVAGRRRGRRTAEWSPRSRRSWPRTRRSRTSPASSA